MSVIFQNIEFHNVEELVKKEKGWAMKRIPTAVGEGLDEGAGELTCFYSTGVELRFRMLQESVVIRLRVDEEMEAQTAFIYFGSFQGGWRDSSRAVGTQETKIVITRPDNMETLKGVSMEKGLPFRPEVVRLVLPYGKCYFCGAEGELAPPRPEDLPERTYLAYGSSITHGSLALAAPYTYPFRISRMLGCDYCNMGFAGSAHLEKRMAEYIVSRKDWDFASVEMGINMLGEDFDDALFEKRVREFVEILGRDARPVFATSIFGIMGPEREIVKAERFRNIVKKHAEGKLIFTDGLELLDNSAYISQDMTHPTLEGIGQIADRWGGIMKQHLAGGKE